MNRRGLKTRQHILDTAVECLAEGGNDSVSANLIAKRAGVTWGTVQHQFGDADAMWSAVIEHAFAGSSAALEELVDSGDGQVGAAGDRIRDGLTAVVDRLWVMFQEPRSRAIHNLRSALSRSRQDLALEYPSTAEALRVIDGRWATLWGALFQGYDVDEERLARVRALIPGALRGLHVESQLYTHTDVDGAKVALVEGLTAYLTP